MAITLQLMQTALVVDDLGDAIAYWAKVLGVGPFFVFPHVRYAVSTYRGAPSPVDISLAFAFSGDMQIELVCQHNDVPSVFQEFRQRCGPGVQHLGAVVDRFEEERERLRCAGMSEVQHLLSETGSETIYFLSDAQPGPSIELIRGSPRLAQRFAEMKQAAAVWDCEQIRIG